MKKIVEHLYEVRQGFTWSEILTYFLFKKPFNSGNLADLINLRFIINLIYFVKQLYLIPYENSKKSSPSIP
jgi:hypothetical protein